MINNTEGLGKIDAASKLLIELSNSHACGICGHALTFDAISNGYEYFLCDYCKTSQLLPLPSHEDLKKYYDNFHKEKANGGVYDDIEYRMQQDFPTKVNIILNTIRTSDLRLLDVGCGKGYFVKAAVDAGIRAEGIDLSNSGVEFAVKTLNVKAWLGSIQDHYDKNEWFEAFDAITLWATIEHLREPAIMLSSIFKCLKPGGVLFCDTGLRDSHFEQYLVGHSQWHDAPQHLYVFSEKGLRIQFEKSGFTIMSSDRNFERTLSRRSIKYLRHMMICLLSRIGPGWALGKRARAKAKIEMKWPIGLLMMLMAKK